MHGFLQGVHRDHLEKRLSVSHPSVSKIWNSGDGAYHRYFPLISMLADRLAVVFHRPPELWLEDENGDRLPESDPRVRQWRKDEEDAEIDVTLQEVERQVIVLGQTFVEPCWIKGKMSWRVLEPYSVYIDQDPEDPAGITGAPHVSIELPMPTDTINAAPVSVFMTWRRVDKRDQFSRVIGSEYEVFLHDEYGNLMQNPLMPDNVNHYGMHPFTVWRAGKKPASGTFWIPENRGWKNLQIQCDIALMDLDYLISYQSHSVAVARGGLDIEHFETGPASLIKTADTDFDFSFVTPNPQIPALIEAFNMTLRTSAVAESLPPDTWESSSSTRNLGAKQLEQHALKMRRQRVIPSYMRRLRQTFEIHKKVGDYWATNGADRVVLGDVRLGVSLAPIPEAQDKFQAIQSNLQEIANGLNNPIDLLMTTHGITRGEAAKRYERNMRFAANATSIEPIDAPTPDNGTQRPATVSADE